MEKNDSLKKRYLYRLFAGIVSGGLSVFTYTIIPRGLGPVAYGNFSFLTDFFQQMVGFFSLGTSTAFYTKLSKRPQESKLTSFYAYFLIAIGLIMVVFLAACRLFSIGKILWPGQNWIFIIAAALWALWMFYLQVLNNVTDAYGLTVQSEIARIWQRLLSLLLIVALFYFGWLNLRTFFLYHYILMLFLWVLWAAILKKTGHAIWGGWRLSSKEIFGYSSEFYSYCHPLIFACLIGMVTSIFDRWILQKYAGSIEQGFFGLSYRIGGLCFLFTGAMTMLLMREFSVSFEKKDLRQMAVLFEQYIPFLYAVTACFSCFVAVQASNIINIFGGSQYKNALIPVMIMAFYPIHQTYGQLSGAVFLATDQTALKRNIDIAYSLIGIPVTYLLIAPKEMMGLHTGAVGLAMKTVFLQFIFVNIELYFNVRLLKLSFVKLLAHQILCIGSLLCIGWLATFSIGRVAAIGTGIPGFILTGALYSITVAALFYLFPQVFGLKKENVRLLVQASARRFSDLGESIKYNIFNQKEDSWRD